MEEQSPTPENEKKLLLFLWLHDLFKRYYQKETTDDESQNLELWNPESQNIFPFWATDEQTKTGVENVWKSLSLQYGFLTDEENKPKPVLKRFSIRQYIQYAAASVVLFSILTIGYQYSKYQTFDSLQYVFSAEVYYKTGNFETKVFQLPDGSHITLNSNTILAINKNTFNRQRREIWLKDGEAFFDVIKNPHKKFIVHSPDMDVIVKGTSFNIKAYKTLDETTMTVKTGKVEVLKKGAKPALYLPDEKFVLNKTQNKILKETVSPQSIASWKDGMFVLDKVDGKELLLRLSQHFKVSVEAAPGTLDEVQFSADFDKNASLDEVLETIISVYKLKYKKEDNNILLYK